PERLTDDDVKVLLKIIFHRQDTQELLKKLLERKKPETP
ncbi:glutamyl-tRNA amidotransferase, partial [Ruminococcus sp. TM09-4]